MHEIIKAQVMKNILDTRADLIDDLCELTGRDGGDVIREMCKANEDQAGVMRHASEVQWLRLKIQKENDNG